MMQHYNRSTIAEVPVVPEKVIIIHSRYKGRANRDIIDADQYQRDQLTTRLSLRSEK